MALTTPRFNLIKPELTDAANITEMNVNWDKIDAELGVLADGNTVVTLTHSLNGTTHAFTGMTGKTGLVPCQFTPTANFTVGDIATIDDVEYTIQLTSADDPETNLFVTGKSVFVTVDTNALSINFKAGGGLTSSKLATTTATEDKVVQGYTFYSGDKVIKTGNFNPDWELDSKW